MERKYWIYAVNMALAEQTFYNWKARYGGMGLHELQRVKDLEDENARLKRIVANLTLENDAIKTVLEKSTGPAAKREAIKIMMDENPISVRQACSIVKLARSTHSYVSTKKPDTDECKNFLFSSLTIRLLVFGNAIIAYEGKVLYGIISVFIAYIHKWD